jgi:phosphatidylinositol-3-phosphatase
MAYDQRYCVQCGARRGSLPADVAELIGAIHEQGPAPALPPGTPLADSLVEPPSRPRGFQVTMPGPRAAAAAVMGMLGFGVIIGSLAGGTSVAALANAPMIVIGLTHPAAVTTVASAAGSQASSGGGGAGSDGGGAAAALPAQASASPGNAPASSGGSDTGTGTTTSTGYGGLPPVKHVFLIVLSDRGFAQSFGAGASAGYIGGALRRQGELVQNYYAVASAPLANEIALVSGQGPTAQTASDCPSVSRIRPATKGPRGEVIGSGCVYPASTHTLASQLSKAGDSWKAYVQGVSTTSATACKVPKLGSKQPQTARTSTSYLAWRNPFVYFRSLTSGGTCRSHEVGFGQLAIDLKIDSTTPSLAYILPAACNDGSESPCKPHANPGLSGANRFLKSVVPEIKTSAAYQDGGLIAITFDQAPQTGPRADPSACCGPASFPNLRALTTPPAVAPAAMGTGGTSTTDPTTTDTTTTSPTDSTSTADSTSTTTSTTTPIGPTAGEITPTGGGGEVGLLLISRYVKPNSTDVIDYFNHFSLLASIEKLFGLHTLGYAGASGLSAFGVGVFNNYSG